MCSGPKICAQMEVREQCQPIFKKVNQRVNAHQVGSLGSVWQASVQTGPSSVMQNIFRSKNVRTNRRLRVMLSNFEESEFMSQYPPGSLGICLASQCADTDRIVFWCNITVLTKENL